jgi:hypothetical protein
MGVMTLPPHAVEAQRLAEHLRGQGDMPQALFELSVPRDCPSEPAMDRSARLSPDGVYRYELHRIWGDSARLVGWIMLNPSTADADLDDPTIRRCIGFARSWGYGGIVVRNLFALRSTSPTALRGHPDPVGPENDHWLRAGCSDVGTLTVCAWGVHGSLNDRDQHVTELLRSAGVQLQALGVTKDGAPRHPLYLPGSAIPQPWPNGGAT